MSTRPTDSTRSPSRTRDGGRRIVILANEAIGDQALVREIVRHTQGRPAQARIVAPAIVKSPLDLAAGDVDDDIAEARRRLEVSIAALAESGIQATGDVGEADPVLALEDALRLFPADEVIVVAHPQDHATWLEQDVVERTRREVDIPITVIEIEREEGAVKAVREVSPAAVGRARPRRARVHLRHTDVHPRQGRAADRDRRHDCARHRGDRMRRRAGERPLRRGRRRRHGQLRRADRPRASARS